MTIFNSAIEDKIDLLGGANIAAMNSNIHFLLEVLPVHFLTTPNRGTAASQAQNLTP